MSSLIEKIIEEVAEEKTVLDLKEEKIDPEVLRASKIEKFKRPPDTEIPIQPPILKPSEE